MSINELKENITDATEQLKDQFVEVKGQVISLVQAQADLLKSKNPLEEAYKLSQKIPNETIRSKFLSTLFGTIVPYVGTSNVVYKEFTPNKIVCTAENKRPIRNHIGQVHAVCMTLLAETATGFLVGLNMPSDRINLIKSYNVQFRKPSKGNITATATLTDEDIQYIKDTPKGELLIPCVVTDDNKEPIKVEMLWAWIPMSELAERREGKKKEDEEVSKEEV